jgi:hypothetical protein
MNVFTVIGLVGILIYSLLLLQALYWLYQPFRRSAIKVKYCNYKFVFQGVFTFYAVLEIIYYASILAAKRLEISHFISDSLQTTDTLYGPMRCINFHYFSVLSCLQWFDHFPSFSYFLFSTSCSHSLQVINLWGYALNYENTFLISTYYAFALVAINFIVTLGDIAYLCLFPPSLPLSLILTSDHP